MVRDTLRRAVALALIALLAAGCARGGGVDQAGATPQRTSAAAASRSAGGPAHAPASPSPPERAAPDDVKRFQSVRTAAEEPFPTAVRIPAIGVDSALARLGLNADQTIEVPEDWHTAGWWEGGPRPGEQGPAVILGHVDSQSGPAVFYRLREVQPGDEILVDREDGSTIAFAVERTEQWPKNEFPSQEVYFPTLQPGLRLVTCGGAFDRSSGHYTDNIILFARQL